MGSLCARAALPPNDTSHRGQGPTPVTSSYTLPLGRPCFQIKPCSQVLGSFFSYDKWMTMEPEAVRAGVPGMVLRAVHGLHRSLLHSRLWCNVCCLTSQEDCPEFAMCSFGWLVGWRIFIVLVLKCNKIVTINKKLPSRMT